MRHLKQVFLLLDAMGLIAFSLIGCSVALQHDYPRVVVIMAGMLTGISGGIVRDVLRNQVPVVFRRELYASVSLAVPAVMALEVPQGQPRRQHRRALPVVWRFARHPLWLASAGLPTKSAGNEPLLPNFDPVLKH